LLLTGSYGFGFTEVAEGSATQGQLEGSARQTLGGKVARWQSGKMEKGSNVHI